MLFSRKKSKRSPAACSNPRPHSAVSDLRHDTQVFFNYFVLSYVPTGCVSSSDSGIRSREFLTSLVARPATLQNTLHTRTPSREPRVHPSRDPLSSTSNSRSRIRVETPSQTARPPGARRTARRPAAAAPPRRSPTPASASAAPRPALPTPPSETYVSNDREAIFSFEETRKLLGNVSSRADLDLKDSSNTNRAQVYGRLSRTRFIRTHSRASYTQSRDHSPTPKRPNPQSPPAS